MPTKPLRPNTSQFLPRLVGQSGPADGQDYVIKTEVTIIGRGEQCHIVIADPLVSRRHSQITFDGSYCTLEDLGSTNGTYVNNQRLNGPHLLRSGDRVRIADALLIFKDPQATLTGLKLPPLLLESPNRVYVNRRAIDLTVKEFALIAFLFDHADHVCSKHQIARAVWPDWHTEVFDYQVESLVRRVRQKIEDAPDQPHFIITVRGKGYQLNKS